MSGDARSMLVGGLQLAGLSAFALAQPLFDLLGRNPEFFVAHDSTRGDIVLFALALTVGPPAALLLVEALARVAGRRPRAAVHLLFVAGLTALIALQALKRLGWPAALLILAAALVGVAAAGVYARVTVSRSFLTALSPAAPLFAALFLLHSPVSDLILARGEEAQATAPVVADAPVVMIIFDEFPVMSLLDERGQVDAARFPAFGELARHATWFRNASVAGDDTLQAVPAVLTGMYPHKGELPISADHPKNLFTLLGGRYHMKVLETVTHLCPRSLCKQPAAASAEARTRVLASDVGVVYLHVLLPRQLEARLPSISEGWANFRGADVGRPTLPPATPPRRPKFDWGRVLAEAFSTNRRTRFDGFIASIERTDRQPTLYFAHMLLPHRPWSYLPSGKQYGNAGRVFGTQSGIWPDDDWILTQAYRRYLLQLGFVDHMLGRLLARLRATGLYDGSLIVITADEGFAFRVGQPLRGVRESNIADIAQVPLFVKAPHQRRGRIVDPPVQTIDILPTIADVLGIRLHWRLDGRSAVAPSATGRRTSRLVNTSGLSFTVATSTLAHRTRELAAARIDVFGEHTRGLALFAVGPHRELVGKRVDALAVARGGGLSARLDKGQGAWLRSVDLRSAFLPANITGSLLGPTARPGLTLAVAINGRIAALTRSFELDATVKFEALVPESAFRNGANDVELFVVTERSKLERVPLAS